MSSVENIIDYKFINPKLLDEALTHPSASSSRYGNEALFNYERLEFLGDAVLSLVVAELLIFRYPNEREGSLAKRLSGLVHGEALADIALSIGIGDYIKMAQGEVASGGRSNNSNMENALEALIGAIYMDGGIESSKKFIKKHWERAISQMIEPPKDPKTTLQEWAQSKGLPIPSYEVVKTEGLAHAPTFEVRVKVKGFESATASGNSKKKAEKAAAEVFLEKNI